MSMGGGNHHPIKKYYQCCESQFFLQIVVITALVLFSGFMSGLTLGLMSLSIVDLQVLAKSGTPKWRLRASKVLPIVKRQHPLLCTLFIINAAAMEALPIFLHNLVPVWGAILMSVTLLLLFGQIIPHSVCSRYILMIGAAAAPIVRLLVWIFYPVAYPVSKLLDFLLGKGHDQPLFRRPELKTLVDLQSAEAGKGGELTRDETTIIAGALELSEKTARDVMTPLSETFSIEINAKLDRDWIHLIMEKGHNRVPVHKEKPKNIAGLILVKNLLSINPADEVPAKNFTVLRIPRVSQRLLLYDLLNEFQKGLSHVAAVVKQQRVEQPASKQPADDSMREVRLEIHSGSTPERKSLKCLPGNSNVSQGVNSKSKMWSDRFHSEILQITDKLLSRLTADEGEVIGIVNLEDVIRELLKEAIAREWRSLGPFKKKSSVDSNDTTRL